MTEDTTPQYDIEVRRNPNTRLVNAFLPNHTTLTLSPAEAAAMSVALLYGVAVAANQIPLAMWTMDIPVDGIMGGGAVGNPDRTFWKKPQKPHRVVRIVASQDGVPVQLDFRNHTSMALTLSEATAFSRVLNECVMAIRPDYAQNFRERVEIATDIFDTPTT